MLAEIARKREELQRAQRGSGARREHEAPMPRAPQGAAARRAAR